MQYGFKIWSHNESAEEVLTNPLLWDYYSFLELYVVPGSYEKTIRFWQRVKAPFFVIHAPHFAHGCNLSLKGQKDQNRAFLEEAGQFCEELKARHIILHLGTQGSLEESMNQIDQLNLKMILIENKPQISLDGNRCVGASPEEIETVLKRCHVGFCLDVSHAIAYSAHCRQDYLEVLRKFLALRPQHFHLCDGLITNEVDKHMSIGAGNYNFREMISLLPKEACVTLETPKKPDTPLESLVDEVRRLRKHE